MTLQERKFIQTVKKYYKKNGRHNLPWRKTTNPYRILVSEVMLQQTQVERVIPKYKSFLKRFPTIRTLAQAPLGDVLREWQGLGYNRRAKMLHECVKEIFHKCGGRTPKILEELKKLPGIGPYTAGAVMAFAYNKPVTMIETNIRAVYLHHFFKNKTNVSDTKISRLIAITLDKKNPREWYWALMDYGAYVKKEFGNPNKRSKHHTTQKPFKGSDREVRGAILRLLSEGAVSRRQFHTQLEFEAERINIQLRNLEKEGMIQKRKRATQNVYTLP